MPRAGESSCAISLSESTEPTSEIISFLQFYRNLCEDDDLTQDPNFGESRQPQRVSGEAIKEVRELRELMKQVLKNQGEMKATLESLKKQLGNKAFDFPKSSHAEKVTKIFAKAYIQLGRFIKPNASKTEQLKLELRSSPYGIKAEELLPMAEQYERAKFTYWRSEERRRLFGIGSCSNIQDASLHEVTAKICSLLGVKFNKVLETVVLRNTALVRTYTAERGHEEWKQDDKFWINFYKWQESHYGKGPLSDAQWDVIIKQQEKE